MAEPLRPTPVDALMEQACRDAGTRDGAGHRVSIAFLTLQRSRHAGRGSSYVNHVVCLRLGRAVGACYIEEGEIDQATVEACLDRPVAELLGHPLLPIRLAALDAWLGETWPHEARPGVRPLTVPPGTSLEKSLFRARAVVELLDPRPGQRVALIGVVNSLVLALRERGAVCLPCDTNVPATEWGEPVAPSMEAVLEGPDAILATGMTLGNGTFDAIVARARQLDVPLVVFAQTGSAVAPMFVGAGVTGVSAEPYPFFWLSGGATLIHRYRQSWGPEPE